MNIIQVVTEIENRSAGPTYSVVRLAEALADRDVNTSVMSLAKTPNVLHGQGVTYQKYSPDLGFLALPKILSPSRALARALYNSAGKGTIIHVHGLWRMPNVYPGIVAKRANIPFVLSPRGMLGPPALAFSARRKAIFWKLFQERSLKHLTCFHATAPSEVDDIRAYGLSQPVAVIPNGIDLGPVHTTRPSPAVGPRQVLHLGRLHPKKGIDRLLKAWALLRNDVEGWELLIVGPSAGGYLDELRTLASELNLSRVRFKGPLYDEQKIKAYRDASLFVLPTRHENFGIVVAEALAHGTPVISTIGAPWSGLVTERCGWWVDYSPEAIAIALKEGITLEDRERTAMGIRGEEWMRREFSWEGIAKKMEELYQWCAGNAEWPAFLVR